MKARIDEFFSESISVKQEALPHLREGLALSITMVIAAIEEGGKLLIFGNGGSAADSQHIACEFVERIKFPEIALPAIALTTDTSLLTASANDRGFEHVFSRQIEALGHKEDIALAISTSGNSPNVILGLRVAKAHGLQTIAFLGGDGGEAAALADLALIVPSKSPQRIQECHILMGHILAELVEEHFATRSESE